MNKEKGVAAPNYTQIPNVFFDEWMRELSGEAFKVLVAMYRWCGDRGGVAVSQIQDMTKLSAPTIEKAISELRDKEFLMAPVWEVNRKITRRGLR